MDLNIIIRNLKGEETEVERLELSNWLKTEENRKQYERFKLIWQESGRIQEKYKPDLEKAWENIDNRISESQPGKARYITTKWIAIAASFVLLASFVSVFWSLNDSSSLAGSEIVFSTGDQVDSLVLGDGTLVWLNKNSSLTYPENFSDSERRTKLTGEAFFEVEKDAKRPFLIEANGTLTEVLGTSFNLNARQEGVSIAVYTGRVAFSDLTRQKTTVLTPGEQADFVDNALTETTNPDPNTLAWKTGRLIFENAPLPKVVETLSKYYGVPISISMEDPEKQFLTVSFDKQRISEALEVISITLDLRVAPTSEGYILSK